VKNPLLVALPSLKQGENRLSFDLEPGELDLKPREVAENPSFEFFVGKVRVSLVITRSGMKLLLTGSVSYRAKLDCALCACEFECDLSEPANAEFVSYDEGELPEQARGSADVEGSELHGNWLDLLPAVRDSIHLAVPIAPLCRPDCKGLCPECGTDLNRGTCECATARPRPRSV
jgi:uncharacterized protein